MRKVSLGIAGAWLLAIIFLAAVGLSGIASAADIPSSASGTYRGSGATAGWDCELRAFQITTGLGDTSRVLSADCATPGGQRAGAISTANACPTEQLQPPLVLFGEACGPAPFYCVPPGTPKFSVLSYSPATAQCALGEIRVQITSAGSISTLPGTPGPESVMCRTQIVLPATPYPGCGAIAPKPSPHYARLCRQFGMYCGR